MVGGGSKGLSEFVEGLKVTARQIGGNKDSGGKHKRRRSTGFTQADTSKNTTLALGYTYVDILDEENDGTLNTPPL